MMSDEMSVYGDATRLQITSNVWQQLPVTKPLNEINDLFGRDRVKKTRRKARSLGAIRRLLRRLPQEEARLI